jgi:hypothetical protein
VWIGLTIAVAITAYFAYGLTVLDLLPKDITKHYDDPGEQEMWLIRGLAGVSILVGIVTFFFGNPDSFWGGVWPESVGIGLTVLGIDELNRRRSERQYKVTAQPGQEEDADFHDLD